MTTDQGHKPRGRRTREEASTQRVALRVLIGFAVVALLSAVGVFVIGRKLADVQYNVFLLANSVVSGFVIWQLFPHSKAEVDGRFKGLGVKSSGALAASLIIGAGLWYIRPVPKQKEISIRLFENGTFVAQEFWITPTEPDVGRRGSQNSQVVLKVPIYFDALSELQLECIGYELIGKAPYPIEKGDVVRLSVRRVEVPPVPPGGSPDVSVFEALPSADDVRKPAKILPEKVTFMYRNSTPRPLHLWLYDCSRHYRNGPNKANESPPWMDFKILPPNGIFKDFHSFFDTTGWHCFAVKDDKGVPHSLKCRNLCDKQVNKLTIKLDSERGYVAEWE